MFSWLKKTLFKNGILVETIRPNKFTRIDWEFLNHDLKTVVGKFNEKQPVIFDVGANKGQSIDKFKSIWPGSKIHSFEPDKELFGHLSQKVTGQKDITLYEIALGDSNEVLTFHINQKKALNSVLELDQSPENRFSKKKILNSYQVQSKTLDTFINEYGFDQSIDLLKIDVQGFDLNVLKGSEYMLEKGKIKSILIEINFHPMYLNQAKPWEIIEFLARYNISLVGLYEISRSVHHPEQIAWCTALFSLKSK